MANPLAAFGLYLLGGAAILAVGRILAGSSHPSQIKSNVYASGEAPPDSTAIPGYSGFFVIALFFATLHLSVLVSAAHPPSLVTAVYLTGVLLTLLAMLLGDKHHDNSTR
jgi:NADH:ubiquinone oxidoreductase subunit 3 (subunit A)